MSDTTASGAGGGAAPGWYADPHDPAQLRWWSGEAWTEHVSPRAAPVAPAAAPQPVVQQPAAAEPVAQQPAQTIPAVEPAAVAPVVPAVPSAVDPLPSRRALREAGGEPIVATPAPQTAAPQAVVPQTAAPEAAAPQAAVPPTAWNQPAEPVQPATPVQPVAAVQPPEYAQPTPAEPVAAQAPIEPAEATPAQAAPVQNAWDQPVQPEAFPPPTAAPAQPVQPVQAADQSQWNQPAQTAPATAWTLPPMVPSAQSAPLPPVGSLPLGGDPLAGEQRDSAVSGRRTQPALQAGSFSTIWVFLVAITPILAAAAAIYVISSNNYDLTGWMLPVAIAAPYLLGILFAVADRSRLVTLGFERPVSWAWAALTAPVYLIQRAGEARRETGNGGPAVVVWFICFLLAIAAIVGWGFLSHHPLFPGLPS